MALLRKKQEDWKPSENKGLLVGDTIEIDDYRALVELGMADLVDEAGNVLPLPGTVFVCAICFEKMTSHSGYADHVMTAHASVSKHQPVTVEEDLTFEDEEEIESAPKSRAEILIKARAAAKAKRDAAKKVAENG